MPRHTLTALALKTKLAEATERAAATGAVVRVSDGDGLMLVVRQNGEASWVLRYSLDGKRRDLTLGRWPHASLKIAREQAEEARKKIAVRSDPADERAAERAAKVAAAPPPAKRSTTRQLFEQWLAAQAISDVYRENIEAALTKDVLPVIGAKNPGDVTRDDIVKILREIEGRGALVMVRRVRMWLRQMFEYAIDHEEWPQVRLSPVPMGTLRAFRSRKARNFPAIKNADQVPELMRKIRRTENWTIRTALLVSAYLWQRPAEIRQAPWSEFDLDRATWVIPPERMKLRLEHWVPLPRQVVQLLRQHQGVVGEDGWAFPGRRYGQPISEGTLTSRLNSMGYAGTHCPHGFRAMARTILDERLKFDPRFMEKQLSHEIDEKLRGAYNRAEYWDDRVTMMQAWADWLDAQT